MYEVRLYKKFNKIKIHQTCRSKPALEYTLLFVE